MNYRPEQLSDWLGFTLSPEQLAAATAELEPGVIVAGAGTGKTTVMAARVTWLVATGRVRPDQVLGLTFTTKAAAELSARVRRAIAKARQYVPAASEAELADPTVSTYHSFAMRVVSEHGPLVGAEPSARVLTDASLQQLAYRVVVNTHHEFEGEIGSPTALVNDVITLDASLAEYDVDPLTLREADRRLIELLSERDQQKTGEGMKAVARKRRDVAALVGELREEKQRLLTMDFADQLRWAATVARKFPQVGLTMRDRYRVVLLDEYQDTSVTQRVLMQNLFGDGHPVTAVGDPFQAIYGWRGASVRNIDEFPVHFPVIDVDGSRRPAERFGLTENRRSRQAILDIANALAAPLRAIHADTQPLVGQPNPQKQLSPTSDIVCALFDTDLEESRWVAEQVVNLVERGHRYSDITVLLRAMTRVSLLREAMVSRGIPVEVVGVEGLLSLPEVVEITSLLQLLHDPTANAACVRLLSGPRWRIGPRDLRLLGRRAAELAGSQSRERGGSVDDVLTRAVAGADPSDVVSLTDALDDLGDAPLSAEARARMLAVSAELRSLRRHVGEPLGDLVMRVVDATGIEAELRGSADAVLDQRVAAVHAFVSLAADYRDLDGRSSLAGLLRFLADAHRFDASPDADLPSATDSVRIMSMHKAKGLEFPVVIMPSLDAGSFPKARLSLWNNNREVVPYHVRPDGAPDGVPPFPADNYPRATDLGTFESAVRDAALLDEARLAYVAVTRAESTLIASGARWVGRTVRMREPSPYLELVRETCEQTTDGVVAYWSDGTQCETNPATDAGEAAWPAAIDPEVLASRFSAVEAVNARRDGSITSLADCSSPDDAVVADWDRDIAVLLDESQRDHALRREVPLPVTLSTTTLQALLADEESFVRSLVRPMPRRPSSAARRGTRFHAWVEAQYGRQPLLGPDDLPGAADADIDTDADLVAMQERFLELPYANLDPYRLEVDFALPLAGRLVPGRIDAVFRHPDPGGDSMRERWEVVDWKTNREATADPLQLAVYRVAWAERMSVPLGQVDASFVYVRRGEVHRFGDSPGATPLLDRDALEQLLSGRDD